MKPLWTLDGDRLPIDFVSVGRPTRATSETALPAEWRELVVVDTLHDGDWIPPEVAQSPRLAEAIASGDLHDDFCAMRDWGADLVAGELAAALGLGGYLRVNVARVVMDFNRFPGSSPPDTPHTRRFAISGKVADALAHNEKRHVLETYYDRVSAGMETAIDGARIKLAIHTYDEHNATRTRRPEVSLLSRSESYQMDSRLPAGIFDPLFPDELAESSTHRLLRDRVSLVLEKAGHYVEHNYPYLLPDGSLEIRCQPWFFFRYLKQIFQAECPEMADEPAMTLIWEMLLNTNLRHPDSASLAGYLHRFLRAPDGREAEYADARRAYDLLTTFLHDRPEIVSRYRRSNERVSALTIEVRKDLVWRFDGSRPVGPNRDRAKGIAQAIARAVRIFATEDWHEAL